MRLLLCKLRQRIWTRSVIVILSKRAKVYAQLVTLDGEQQEIIQRGNLVSYFQPGSSAFTINSGEIVDALPAVIRTDFSKLSQNYGFY